MNNNDNNTNLIKIRKLAEQEEYEKALKMLDEELERVPENTELMVEKAKIYNHLQQYSEAINTLREVLKINPGHKEARNMREMCFDILRSQQLDIYSSTNLSNDPWLDE